MMTVGHFATVHVRDPLTALVAWPIYTGMRSFGVYALPSLLFSRSWLWEWCCSVSGYCRWS